LPSFHRKLEIRRRGHAPSPCRLKPGRLVKRLLHLHQAEVLKILLHSPGKAATADLDGQTICAGILPPAWCSRTHPRSSPHWSLTRPITWTGPPRPVFVRSVDCRCFSEKDLALPTQPPLSQDRQQLPSGWAALLTKAKTLGPGPTAAQSLATRPINRLSNPQCSEVRGTPIVTRLAGNGFVRFALGCRPLFHPSFRLRSIARSARLSTTPLRSPLLHGPGLCCASSNFPMLPPPSSQAAKRVSPKHQA